MVPKRQVPGIGENVAVADVIGGIGIIQCGVEGITESEAVVTVECRIPEEGTGIVLPVSECVIGVDGQAMNGPGLEFGAHAVVAREPFVASSIQSSYTSLVQT